MADGKSKFDTEGFERWEYRIGGINTVVYTVGQGPPVMYLHGGGTWHGFAWAREWQNRFKVILPYHPGFGESADDPSIASMDDYVQHYIELCDAMNLRGFSLIGTSFGGYMATAFAITHPGRLTKLVLACPAGISDPAFPMGNFRNAKPDDIPGMFAVNKDFVKEFWPDRWNERIGREGASAGKGFGPSTTSGPKLLRHMPRVTMPTLVIWGKEDRVLPVGLAGLWGKAIPHATVRIIDNAGHLLLDESQEARNAVKSWLG